MKIVYTTHQFLPHYAAGTETLAYLTAKEMQRRGHDVHVITGHPVKGVSEKCESFDHYDHEGIPVDRFYHSNTRSLRPDNPMEAEYNNLVVFDFFYRRVKELRPDLVHFYHLQRLSASPINVCYTLGVPTVFTATDFWLICPTNQLLLPDHSLCLGPDEDAVNCVRHLVSIARGGAVQKILESVPNRVLALLVARMKSDGFCVGRIPGASLVKGLAKRLDCMKEPMARLGRILVATRFMAQMLIGFGIEAEKIYHLPFGIDRERIDKVSRKGNEKRLRFGFIGTLYHHKGAHLLLEAVRLLPKRLPIEVKVYGSLDQFPGYVETLRSIAGSDPRIVFCGTFPDREIGAVFQQMDVLVVPSLWYENTPLVIHWAQGAEVPVVATNLGGMNEVVQHGVKGLLFEKGDVKGLSGIILRLCNDRPMVGSLSNHSKAPRSVPSYVDELEQVYRHAMHDDALC